MEVRKFPDKNSMAEAAASHAAASIRKVIQSNRQARILVATGTSQLEFQQLLMKKPGIDWSYVELFQLDDYIGLPISHPASFHKILSECFIRRVGITKFQLLNGAMGPQENDSPCWERIDGRSHRCRLCRYRGEWPLGI